MNSIKKLLFFAAFLFSLNAYATPADDLNQLLGTVKSMQAGFIQQAMGKHALVRQSSTGTLALLKPGRFRWDIVQPTHQSIIADGKNLWVYDRDLQQVTVQALQKVIDNSPALLLSGGGGSTLLQQYNVTRVPQKEVNVQAFALQAKNPNAVYSNVNLFFVNNIISQMQITDQLGQHSTVYFSNVTVNPVMRPGIFNFTPPRGTDVVQR